MAKQSNPWAEWDKRISRLCFKVFHESDEGRELLKLWEERFFYSYVAHPEQNIGYTYMTEGRNEFVRGIKAMIQKEMIGEKKATEIKRDNK